MLVAKTGKTLFFGIMARLMFNPTLFFNSLILPVQYLSSPPGQASTFGREKSHRAPTTDGNSCHRANVFSPSKRFQFTGLMILSYQKNRKCAVAG